MMFAYVVWLVPKLPNHDENEYTEYQHVETSFWTSGFPLQNAITKTII